MIQHDSDFVLIIINCLDLLTAIRLAPQWRSNPSTIKGGHTGDENSDQCSMKGCQLIGTPMCLLQVYFTSMVQWCEERLKAYNLKRYTMALSLVIWRKAVITWMMRISP